MKPDEYRIESRMPNDAYDSNWGVFGYQSALSDQTVIKRASAFSNDFDDADWRVMRYSDTLREWMLIWEATAEKPKPTKFEHCGVKLTFREDGGINIKSPRREQYESGYAALQDHEVAALRAYFKSEG